MKRAPIKRDLDIDQLRNDFTFDAEKGQLYWTASQPLNNHKHKPAGRIGNRGYVCIKYRGRDWLAHVLIWTLLKGELPRLEIDHIDRNKANNRPENLREVTHAENMSNIPRASRNRAIGITYVSRSQKWQSQITLNGTTKYLGTYSSKNEALASYRAAASVLRKQEHPHG
jgi:hypothetical protein